MGRINTNQNYADDGAYTGAQCQSFREAGDAKPEGKLAALMYRELCVSVSRRELRLFIKAHWSKISALAHQIHDED